MSINFSNYIIKFNNIESMSCTYAYLGILVKISIDCCNFDHFIDILCILQIYN